MNLRQAQRFAEKVYGKPIRIILGDSKKKWYASCFVDWGIVVFEKEWWKDGRKKPAEVKATILHEIGHIKSKSRKVYHINRPRGEYYAHTWAIRKAKQLGLKKVVKRLRWEIRNWKNFKWKSCYRRYLIAAQMFMDKPV